MSAEGIRLYDPTAAPRTTAATLAPRLQSIEGKRVGILDNGKANAGTLMLAVARILQERYGAGEIVKRDRSSAGAWSTRPTRWCRSSGRPRTST